MIILSYESPTVRISYNIHHRCQSYWHTTQKSIIRESDSTAVCVVPIYYTVIYIYTRRYVHYIAIDVNVNIIYIYDMHFGFVLAARVIYNKNPIYFPRIGTTYAHTIYIYIGICIPHITYIILYSDQKRSARPRVSGGLRADQFTSFKVYFNMRTNVYYYCMCVIYVTTCNSIEKNPNQISAE